MKPTYVYVALIKNIIYRIFIFPFYSPCSDNTYTGFKNERVNQKRTDARANQIHETLSVKGTR